MKPNTFAAVLLLATTGAFAQTASYTYQWSGTTAGGPSFSRPEESLGGLSSVLGVGARYSAFSFYVNLPGPYEFFSDAENHRDNFLLLYSPSFTPGTPLANVMLANDDHPDDGVGHAGFNVDLLGNRTYVLVTTGFAAAEDFGRYFNSITGPGVVTAGVAPAVPEPERYAMLALGLATVLTLVHKRAARQVAHP